MGGEILVLDEPTSMLDLQDRRDILDLLHKFHSQGNKTIVLITHSLEEALRARKLILLNQGRIAFSGSATDFLAREGWRRITGCLSRPCNSSSTIFAPGVQYPYRNHLGSGAENSPLENEEIENRATR